LIRGHLAQEIGVRGLLHQGAQVHHGLGHPRIKSEDWFLRIRLVLATRPYRRATGDHPRSRSLTTALWRARSLATALPPSYTITRDTTINRRESILKGRLVEGERP
jgi:hypothetical protein